MNLSLKIIVILNFSDVVFMMQIHISIVLQLLWQATKMRRLMLDFLRLLPQKPIVTINMHQYI